MEVGWGECAAGSQPTGKKSEVEQVVEKDKIWGLEKEDHCQFQSNNSPTLSEPCQSSHTTGVHVASLWLTSYLECPQVGKKGTLLSHHCFPS